MSSSSRIVRFGKYKDWPISEVPTGYLRWALENIDGSLADWAEDEIEDRLEDPSHPMYASED